MKIKLIISTLTFFSFLNLFSQETQTPFCNPMFDSNLLSFEIDDLEDIDSNLSILMDENYKVNIDSLNIKNGSRSLRIEGLKEDVKTYATISLKIPLKIKKESSVGVTVWVKTDSLNGENAGAILRLMGYNDIKGAKPTAFEFSKSILTGSKEWTEISLSIILKEDTNYIVLSGLMQGKGRAWFDNFNLKINSEKINDILFFENDNEANKTKTILNQYVTPLEISSLKQIGDYISNQNTPVKIIGLGEATHGTSEVYNYKTEIIKNLIKNNGVRKIALEAYYANTTELNKYIITGNGDLKSLISELKFFQYYTNEFYEFLIWLKDFNKNTNDKISIIGVDSQSGGNSLQVLTEKFNNNMNIYKLISQLNDTIHIAEKIKISETLFKELSNSQQDENTLNNARILNNSYILDQYTGLKYSRIRDSLMAINIQLLEKKLTPDQKIVYWAHDLHVQKKEGWTGGYLNNQYADKYVNLGFLLGNGQFTAIDKKSRKLDSDNLLLPPKCNSLEALMDNFKYPFLLFKNKSASNDPYLKENFYDNYLEKRSIGALDISIQFTFLGDDPGDLFDLLIYIKNSNPSKLLNKFSEKDF